MNAAPATVIAIPTATNAQSTEVQRIPAEPQPHGSVEHRQYVLRAANAGGTTEQPFNLYVLRPPRIEAFTYTVSQVGDRVTLTYRTAGAERVLLNGNPVEATDAFVIRPGEPWTLSGMSADFRLLHVTTARLDAAT